MGDLFQKFLNKVGRGYGQVDKNVFGGLLPGGSDSSLVHTPRHPLSPGAIVRSAPFQTIRDAALEKTGLPKPEQFFIKAMTGGSKDITSMSPEEIALIKGAYENQKTNYVPPSQEQINTQLKQAELSYANFQNMLKQQNNISHPLIKNSPLGYETAEIINTPFDKKANLAMIMKGVNNSIAASKNPVVNLYGQGRNARMAYGNLSVFPQKTGGVEIYDQWKVDPPNKVLGLDIAGDSLDSVADLTEGGAIPSLVYNAAKALGTYEPFNIRINVPASQWNKTKGILLDENKPQEKTNIENQGSFLHGLNKLYERIRY